MSAPLSLLSAHQLGVSLDGRQILRGIDLEIVPGETISLIGPNGAGKTTLLRALLGLQPLTTGHVSRKPGLRLGYVPQRLQIDSLLPMSVRSFMQLWPAYNPVTAAQCLEQTGAQSLIDRPLQRLSGGEFQRVLLARALMNAPDLLVLDEPAQALDIQGQATLYSLIAAHQKQSGCAVLMVSHDLHVVMRETSRVICLNQHICCQGHPDDVSRDPAYETLFGPQARAFAVYHHHHDHHHG